MSPPRIVPVGSFGCSGAEKHTILLTGWVFDARLDPAKLEAAWKQLTAAWPILSARLRKDAKDNWFFHIPTCTPDYDFRVVHEPGPIRTAYAFSEPSEQIRLTVKANPDDLYSSPDPWRRKLPELMKADKPISQLSLTLFSDASVLGLSVPHVLSDGMGVAEIMRALAAVLRGQPAPPLAPPDCDPFAAYLPKPQVEGGDTRKGGETGEGGVTGEGEATGEGGETGEGGATGEGGETGETKGAAGRIPSGWRIFSALQMALFVLCTVWDMLRRRGDENRELYFPPDEVRRLKREAMDDLRRLGKEGEYVSTSDAVFAFMLKCIYTRRLSTSKHPLSLFYSANMRNHLTDVFPAGRTYIREAARGVVVTTPVASVPTESLGALALKIRRALHAQTTRAYTESYLRFRMRAHAAGTTPVFFASPRAYWNVVTNWRDQRLMAVDLSPAAEEQGTKVSARYVWGMGYQSFPMRNCFGLVADDARGGLWVGGFFPRAVWEDPEGFGRFIHS